MHQALLFLSQNDLRQREEKDKLQCGLFSVSLLLELNFRTPRASTLGAVRGRLGSWAVAGCPHAARIEVGVAKASR